MSSRALRKALREKENINFENETETAEDDVDENSHTSFQAKQSAFALLNEDDNNNEDESDEGIKLEDDDAVEQQEQAAPASGKKKSKKKKKKAKSTKTAADSTHNDNDEELDEIDAALKELSTSNNTSSTTALGNESSKSDETYRLLAVDRNNLHAQNEMRKLFGRAAVDHPADDAEPPPEAAGVGNRRQQRRMQHGGLAQALQGQRAQGGRPNGISQVAMKRNLFIQGKEEWPAATGGGLGMEVVGKHADGVVEYRYVHSRIYQDVQLQFEACVESMDPNRMVVLLQHNPYHISTLLQVSEIAKSERDHTTAGDLLERALFSLGRAVHSTFAKNVAEGKARLDYRRPENRELWLASWRYIQNLSMRGTWRTVYEWTKLLLALSPHEDPYALWLILDQYALRSKQDVDYLNLARDTQLKAIHEKMPNVQLSQGLSECRSGNKSRGQQLLYTAISQHPWFVARLLQELDIDAPPAIWGKTARTDKEKLYAELYATRAKDIWNIPEHSSILIEIASAIPAETKSAPPIDEDINLTEARHVILSDIPALIALVPRKFTANLNSVSDPLPPEENIITYDTQNMSRSAGVTRGSERSQNTQPLQTFLQGLFPWLTRFSAARADAPDDEQTLHEMEAEIRQRAEETGADPDVVIDELETLIELHQNMTADQSQQGNNQATVEDVEDEDR